MDKRNNYDNMRECCKDLLKFVESKKNDIPLSEIAKFCKNIDSIEEMYKEELGTTRQYMRHTIESIEKTISSINQNMLIIHNKVIDLSQKVDLLNANNNINTSVVITEENNANEKNVNTESTGESSE